MVRRDLGRMAEKTLEHWAAEEGITCNKASDDKTGWDYYLEFPFSADDRLDTRPPPIVALVQVKGTDGRRNRKDIKLDAWERLIKAPVPTFYLIIHYKNGRTPVEAFLVHVGEEYIRRVLKRLREESSNKGKSKPKKLYDITMSVSWKKEEKLNAPNGSALCDAIRAVVGDDLRHYLETKTEWIKTVGYDKLPYTFTFTTSASPVEEMWEAFSNHAIGLTDHIPIESFHSQEMRFDIARPLSSLDEGGTISIGPPPALDGRVTLQKEDGSETIILNCKVLRVFSFLPEEYRKVRFISGYLDIILDAHDNVKFTFDLSRIKERRVRLSTINDTVNACRLLLDFRKAPIKINWEVQGKSYSGALSSMGETMDIPDLLRRELGILEHFREIVQEVNVRGDPIVDIDLILKQHDRIHLASAVLSKLDGRFCISFEYDQENIQEGTLIGCPIVTEINIGDYYIGVSGAALGPASIENIEGKTNRMVKLTDVHGIVVEKWFTPNNGRKSVEEQLGRVDSKLEEQGYLSVHLGELLNDTSDRSENGKQC